MRKIQKFEDFVHEKKEVPADELPKEKHSEELDQEAHQQDEIVAQRQLKRRAIPDGHIS